MNPHICCPLSQHSLDILSINSCGHGVCLIIFPLIAKHFLRLAVLEAIFSLQTKIRTGTRIRPKAFSCVSSASIHRAVSSRFGLSKHFLDTIVHDGLPIVLDTSLRSPSAYG